MRTGMGMGSGWERARRVSQRSAPGLAPAQSGAAAVAEGTVQPRSLWLGGSSRAQPSLSPAWTNFIPTAPAAPSTVAVRGAEADEGESHVKMGRWPPKGDAAEDAGGGSGREGSAPST